MVLPIAVQANSFDSLNDAFVSNVSQLPAIDDSKLKPDRIEQVSGHIHGWIDIVGFQETAKVNRTKYIDGSPADKAVVLYSSWAKIDVPVCSISIQNSMTKTMRNNNTVANLDVKLVWYSQHCGRNGCTCIEHKESASFQDSEISPEQYPTSSIPELRLHEFSNSSRTLLEVNVDDTITAYNVSTQNGSIKKHIQIGHVEYTQKVVPFANFTNNNNYSIWYDAGTGVYHQSDDVILDSNNFSFSAQTPFRTISEFNTTKIQEKPTSMSSMNILIFFMLGLGYIACMLVWKVARI